MIKATVFAAYSDEWASNYYVRYSDGTQGGFKFYPQYGSAQQPVFKSHDGRMSREMMEVARNEWLRNTYQSPQGQH